MWPALDPSLTAVYVHHPAQLRRRLERDGGFTVRLRSGAAVRSGVSVCSRPGSSLSFPLAEWDDCRVDGWMASIATTPSWRSSCIGGWLDPSSGTVWLDAVQVVPARWRRVALAVGRRAHQMFVFDLGRGETVAVR